MNKPITWAMLATVLIISVLWFVKRPNEANADSADVSVIDSDDAGSTQTVANTAGPSSDSGANPGAAIGKELLTPGSADSLPIDVTPGFEFLSDSADTLKPTDFRSTLVAYHRQLQSELRDPDWSERTEADMREAIEGELSAAGLDTQRIEISVLECRTSGCEIQALGFREDNGKAGDLQRVLPKVLRGGLGDDFDLSGFSITLSSRADGRVTYFAVLPRKQS